MNVKYCKTVKKNCLINIFDLHVVENLCLVLDTICLNQCCFIILATNMRLMDCGRFTGMKVYPNCLEGQLWPAQEQFLSLWARYE